MVSGHKIEGTGDVFVDSESLGRADFVLFDTSTTSVRSAQGTLNFHGANPCTVPTRPLTIRLEDGNDFQVVITEIRNGQISVDTVGTPSSVS